MLAIFKRELKVYFSSPTGYVFMGMFLLIAGIFFAFGNILSRSSNFSSFLNSIQFAFLFVIPVLTMRLMSEETRQKTDQLLYTSPVKIHEVVLGKYLAALMLFVITFAISCLYSLVIVFFGDFQVWESLGGILGFLLIGASFIAVGTLISTMTESQAVAGIVTLVTLLIFWLLEPIKGGLPQDATAGLMFASALALAIVYGVYTLTKSLVTGGIILAVLALAIGLLGFFQIDVFTGFISQVIEWFSLLKRQESFVMGLIKLDNVVYYLSFIFVALYLSVRFIEKRRWM